MHGQAAVLETELQAQRKRLWSLCYRMSGCAADADDLVQEVFVRALQRPPEDLQRALGPWLTRVAMNACRDHLRRRKLRGYAGPWLPGPIETAELEAVLDADGSPEARYGMLESVSLAFLHALETLTPNQRAVLVLRDVLELSVAETADALELSEGVVKTTLHRARTALQGYDATRRPHSPQRNAAARAALEAFMVHLFTNNVDAMRELLAQDVVALNDGAGEYFAAKRPVVGCDKVILFHRKTLRLARGVLSCSLNGRPGMMFELVDGGPRLPRRAAVWVEIDDAGRITELHYALASRKLARLPWARLSLPSPRLVLRMLRAAAQTPRLQRWAPALGRRLLGRVLRRAAGDARG